MVCMQQMCHTFQLSDSAFNPVSTAVSDDGDYRYPFIDCKEMH